MAGYIMPAAHVAVFRRFLGTFFAGHGASCAEFAARGRIGGRGQIPCENDTLSLPSGIRNGNRRHKSLRIRVKGIVKNLVLICQFHNIAKIHDCHTVTDIFHHRKIVRNEDIGKIPFLLQIAQKVDDL